jgi:hypothetical protein
MDGMQAATKVFLDYLQDNLTLAKNWVCLKQSLTKE